jgi:hypothetical protein
MQLRRIVVLLGATIALATSAADAGAREVVHHASSHHVVTLHSTRR